MKLLIERDALAPALDAVAKTVPTKSPITVITCVRLRAGDGLTISAHSLDTCMDVEVAADVAAPGTILVAHETFRSIVRGLPEGRQISLSAEDGKLTIVAGRSRYKLGYLEDADFPPMLTVGAGKPDAARPARFPLDGGEAERLLARPRFACLDDVSRPHYGGIFLQSLDGRLWGIGSDGNILFANSIPLPEGAGDLPETEAGARGIIIPLASLDGVARALAGGGHIEADANIIVAVGKTTRFASKLIGYAFPPIWKFIPERHEPRMMVADRADMIGAVTRLAAVTTKDMFRASMGWDDASEDASLSLATHAAGDGQEFVPLFQPAAGTVRLTVSQRYMASVIGAMKGDRIEISHVLGKPAIRVYDLGEPDVVALIALMDAASAT